MEGVCWANIGMLDKELIIVEPKATCLARKTLKPEWNLEQEQMNLDREKRCNPIPKCATKSNTLLPFHIVKKCHLMRHFFVADALTIKSQNIGSSTKTFFEQMFNIDTLDSNK